MFPAWSSPLKANKMLQGSALPQERSQENGGYQMAGNCAKAAGQGMGTAADRTFGVFSFFDTRTDVRY